MQTLPRHLKRLEDESIHIMREVVAEFRNPVFLYSIGKDSSVMLHLALKAFYPAPPPFPFLHIASTWDFREMIEHRDRMVREHGLRLIVHTNEDALAQGISPLTSDVGTYTRSMLTDALKQALTQHGFDAAFGGGRRDEEKARAKERIFSFRSGNHGWDPKNQRPELTSRACRPRQSAPVPTDPAHRDASYETSRSGRARCPFRTAAAGTGQGQVRSA